MRVRRARRQPRGVYLHLHGGGWTLGAADLQDALFAFSPSRPASPSRASTTASPPSIRTRPGPTTARRRHGGFSTAAPRRSAHRRRFAIGGESAGAHLAVVTLLRLRDRHGITGAFDAANLFYGAYDLTRHAEPAALHRRARHRRPVHGLVHRELPARARRERTPQSRHLSALRRPAGDAAARSSPSARSTRCSTTRSSWPRAGRPPATMRSSSSTRTACTASTRSRSSSAARANEAQAAFLSRVAAGVTA